MIKKLKSINFYIQNQLNIGRPVEYRWTKRSKDRSNMGGSVVLVTKPRAFDFWYVH